MTRDWGKYEAVAITIIGAVAVYFPAIAVLEVLRAELDEVAIYPAIGLVLTVVGGLVLVLGGVVGCRE